MAIDKEKMGEVFGNLNKDSVVGILIQRFPDPDAIGSAAGFAVLLKEIYELESKIYHYGKVSHPQNKSLVNVLHIDLNQGEDLDPKSIAKTVVLDTDLMATGFMENELTIMT